MSKSEFDWTEILPEPERSKVRTARQAGLAHFLDGFPTKDEIEQAGREGRAAFARARVEVDQKKFRQALHTLLADAADDLGVDFVKSQLRDAEALVGTLPPCPLHNLQDGETCPVCGCMGNGEG